MNRKNTGKPTKAKEESDILVGDKDCGSNSTCWASFCPGVEQNRVQSGSKQKVGSIVYPEIE